MKQNNYKEIEPELGYFLAYNHPGIKEIWVRTDETIIELFQIYELKAYFQDMLKRPFYMNNLIYFDLREEEE